VKSLYLRIYITVVAVLLLFASGSGWVVQRHLEQERVRAESVLTERMAAWAELIQRSLPGVDAPPDEQGAALRDWSQRLRIPLALDSAAGERIGASESFLRRSGDGVQRGFAVQLEDGRTLWVMRPGGGRQMGPNGRLGPGPGLMPMSGGGPLAGDTPPLPFIPPAWQQGVGMVVVLIVLFIAVSAGAYPVVRRLTRRLEALKQGVERFGSGQLAHRVEVSGRDEVAAVAASFNHAASRVELLANASHELRSPLARMKMAVSMLEDASPAQRERLKSEIDTNVAELDALVEEVLLASRLDATPALAEHDAVDLLALAAEESARVDAAVDGNSLVVQGEERLLRRALRNLLENAHRYGGGDITVHTERVGAQAQVKVSDRGPGVPEALRERVFEAFYRMPGHAEKAGGVGLGLSLVKQIAERHGGSVRCEAREGGGSCFVLSLPVSA
jgi:signal transduction histidine kinase